MKRGDTLTVMYWPWSLPIPDGWAFCALLGDYHGAFSFLIRKLP